MYGAFLRFRPHRTAAATEVNKTPVRGEMGKDEEGPYPDESRSIEDLRHMRLMALLRDMIDSETGEKATKALGTNYRTVSRAVESGRLTERMIAELELHLLLGGGSAAAQQREIIGALEERLRELEIELIKDRKLMLPPSTYPWDSFDRRNRLLTRKQALERARVQRARAELRRWLRRVITFGLWRNTGPGQDRRGK